MSLVLWSGGCDSTLVLFELAAEALAAGKPLPRALSIVYDQQVPAAYQHRKARERILRELAQRGLKIEHSELSLSLSGENYVKGSPGLPQPVLWLTAAQLFLEPDEDLYAAYIRGDDIWHYRQFLFSVFDNAQALLRKSGKLQLPLEWESKDGVLKDLQSYGLLKLCWYCETVRGESMKPCGWCPSCKTMAAGRFLAKRKWGYDKPPKDDHEPETKDEPEKHTPPRRRRQAQRKKALARRRGPRHTDQAQKRKADRPRQLR